MIQTTWGYTITDADALTDILTAEEFNTLTANKYSGDVRIPGNITAASQAVRNYCGWHVFPGQACELITTADALSVTRSGSDYLIQLPARFVIGVSYVLFDAVHDGEWTGDAYEFSFESNGLLRAYDVPAYSRMSKVRIVYTAGVPDGLMGAVKELVAHRVTHALASSSGVTSESAGGMSITYNANWINSARASALPDDNKEVLTPYRLQGVF